MKKKLKKIINKSITNNKGRKKKNKIKAKNVSISSFNI